MYFAIGLISIGLGMYLIEYSTRKDYLLGRWRYYIGAFVGTFAAAMGLTVVIIEILGMLGP